MTPQEQQAASREKFQASLHPIIVERRLGIPPWQDLKRRVDDICGPSHAADDVDISDLERPEHAESRVDTPPEGGVGSESAQ